MQGKFDNVINADKISKSERPKYLAYLAYSRACLDNAEDMCITANELLAKEQDGKAGWVGICTDRAPSEFICKDFPVEGRDYETTRGAERNLMTQFAEFSK